jgi:hypothetical protein
MTKLTPALYPIPSINLHQGLVSSPHLFLSIVQVLLPKARILLLLILLFPFSFSYAAMISSYQSIWTLTLYTVDGGAWGYEEKEMATTLSSFMTAGGDFRSGDVPPFDFSELPMENVTRLSLPFFAMGAELWNFPDGSGIHNFQTSKSMEMNGLTVPVPAAGWLFASSLIGLCLMVQRKIQ